MSLALCSLIYFEYVRSLISVCVLMGELNAPLAWS